MKRPFIPSSFVPISTAITLAAEAWHPEDHSATVLTKDEAARLARQRQAAEKLARARGQRPMEDWIERATQSGTAIPRRELTEAELEQLAVAAEETKDIADLVEREELSADIRRAVWAQLRDNLFVRQIDGEMFSMDTSLRTPLFSERWRFPEFDTADVGDVITYSVSGTDLRWVATFAREHLSHALALTSSEEVEKNEATNAGKTACKKWLVVQMRASPQRRPKPKIEFEKEALELFEISGRSFDSAWGSACEQASSNWNKAGRPKSRLDNPSTKSQH